jgi:GH15 family glucan-1,4-alpha-glucosidase
MSDDYTPIEDYGAIGNLRTAALVGLTGSVDWCCLPQFDSPSVFAALLDRSRGGRWLVRPAAGHAAEQSYLEDTNVLETAFRTDDGRLVVTDFMPLAGSIEGCGGSTAEPELRRLLHADGAAVEVEVEWCPRPGYADAAPRITATAYGYRALSGDDALTLAGLPAGAEISSDRVGPLLRARVRLQAGESLALVMRWGPDEPQAGLERTRQALRQTLDSWRGWVRKEEATGGREWAGPYHRRVIRSELALKLLTHADTGAFAAAATTSLPEEIGGVRNWDYRYTWIRDAALAAQALFALGHEQDGRDFIEWAERAPEQRGEPDADLRIVYGLHGEEDLDETDLPNLEGYRRSSPVRVGNGAAGQLQLDIYGELLDAAHELIQLGQELEPDILAFLPTVADQACRAWRRADYGLWELRNGPFHFVYSKAMVWMALDRAARLADAGVIEGDVAGWRRQRDLIRHEVLERGYDPATGAFRQSYERSGLDASNLLLPMLDLLPFSDPRVRSNLDRTIEGLTENGLVYRYRIDDGIAGSEGAFVLCTFWLVDALALSDRVDEAGELFEGVLSRGNHLGLYSEQIDPSTGAFLGNFPQAFSHLGLINSALYLAYKQGKEVPVRTLRGTGETSQGQAEA